jgi:hypothetical protein
MGRVQGLLVILVAVVAVVAVAAATAACAAGSVAPAPTAAATDAGPSMATVQEYCAARAAAECTGAVMQQCGADVTACQMARAAFCAMQVPEGTTYQPQQAPACIAAASAMVTTGTVTAMGQAAMEVACGTQLFAGPGGPRSPCTNDYDCNSSMGLSCVTPTGQTTAKCLVPNVVANGGPCPNEQDECGGDFYCNPMSLECVRDAALNEPCGAGWTPCSTGLDYSGSGPFSSCTAKPADGAACETSSDCNSGLCDKLTDQAQGNCVEQIVLSSLDSICATFR